MRSEDISDALEFMDEGMLERAVLARENGKRKQVGVGKEKLPEEGMERWKEAQPEGRTEQRKRKQPEGQKGARTNVQKVWKIRGAVAAVLCLACIGTAVGWLELHGGPEGKPPREELARQGQAGQEESGLEGQVGQEDPDRAGLVTQGTPEAGTPERFVEIDSLLASRNESDKEMAQSKMEVLRGAKVPMPSEGYVAVYEMVESADAAFLAESMGKMLDGAEGWHYVSGHSDRQYLIRNEEEEVSLWKFQCFDSDSYPYADVLELVYQVHSAEDILELEVTPAKMDNSDEGMRIQEEIGTLSVTDRAAIEAVYDAISGMTCHGSGRWDLIDYGDAEGAADSGLKSHDAVRLGRYLAMTTPHGNVIDGLKYTAVSDMFYEFSGIAYDPLTQEQAAAVREALGIVGSNTP